MRVLNNDELDVVAGGDDSIWKKIREVINEIDDAYADAIESATNMMCTGTGNC